MRFDHRTSNAHHHRNQERPTRSSLDPLERYDSPSRMKQTASGPQAIQQGAWRRRPSEASRSIPSVTLVGLTSLRRERTASSKILRPPKKEAFLRSLDAAVVQNLFCLTKRVLISKEAEDRVQGNLAGEITLLRLLRSPKRLRRQKDIPKPETQISSGRSRSSIQTRVYRASE